MAKDMTRDQGWVPRSCTLPTAEQPLRRAEFDSLFADSMSGMARPERTRLRLELRPGPANAARTAELATRENECCSFFTFVLTVADAGLTLDVAVPPEHIEVLDALQARAAAVARLDVVDAAEPAVRAGDGRDRAEAGPILGDGTGSAATEAGRPA
ncbi:hypothetical protein AB0K60_18690 [Thermopolyspora sp. NPDC052614]|uniref:hypothetical protein n=1 Tax=Thermopolyspora sp. NPDC052614 TaxID=3155682 RepID=UPI0034401B6A